MGKVSSLKLYINDNLYFYTNKEINDEVTNIISEFDEIKFNGESYILCINKKELTKITIDSNMDIRVEGGELLQEQTVSNRLINCEKTIDVLVEEILKG